MRSVKDGCELIPVSLRLRANFVLEYEVCKRKIKRHRSKLFRAFTSAPPLGSWTPQTQLVDPLPLSLQGQ